MIITTKFTNPLEILEALFQESKMKSDRKSSLEFAMPENDYQVLHGLLLVKYKNLEYKNNLYYYRGIIIIPEK